MGGTGTREALPPSGSAMPEGCWYPDPLGKWPLRWWSGSSWTTWVSDGESTRVSSLKRRPRLGGGDIAHLEFISEVFLPELASRTQLSGEQSARAQGLVCELTDEAMQPAPGRLDPMPPSAPVQPTTGVGPSATPREVAGAVVPSSHAASTTVTRPIAEPAPRTPLRPKAGSGLATARTPTQRMSPRTETLTWSPPPRAESAATTASHEVVAPPREAVDVERPGQIEPPAPREPGPVAKWLDRTWESVRSDLAVHGLAYLGVLLFFVGAFGLVAFAFGDVQPGLRPFAEVVIAAVPFLAASLLLRRGAVVVGRALEIAGGLLLPLMIVTSFLDGVAFPPDATGPVLVVSLASACLGLAVGYALWSHRHPQSALRYLVAPMAWVTVAMACLGLGRAVPSGEAVAVPGSAQMAATIVSLAATVLWARRSPQAQLAQPTCVAAVPGLFVFALLAALTWVREADTSALAIGVAGLGGLLTLELLAAPEPPADRLPQIVVAVIEPVWWGVAILGLLVPLDTEWACAVGALGYLAILEFAGQAKRPGWAVALPGIAMLALTATTLNQPWVTAGVLALTSIWALVRRRAPFNVPGAQRGLDVAAALLPVGSLMAFADAWAVGPALFAGSGLVLLTAIATHRTEDGYWLRTWRGWMILETIAAAGWTASQWTSEAGATVTGQWTLVAAVALLAGAAVVGPLSRDARPWASSAFGAWAWVLACEYAGFPDGLRGLTLATVGLALVVAAHLGRNRSSAGMGSLGLAGHTLGLATIVLAGSSWVLAAALALFTAACAVTAFADAYGRSPVGSLVATVDPSAAYVAPVLMTLGLPVTAIAVLHASSPGSEMRWAPLVLPSLAVAMAGGVRVELPIRIAQVFVWVSFALPLLTLAALTEPADAIPALLGLVAVVALLPGDRRWRGMVWVAWAGIAPLTGLVAAQALPTFASEAYRWQAAVTLCVVGSAQLLGAAAGDVRGGPRAPRWRPGDPALTPVAFLGAAEVALGVALTMPWVPDQTTGLVLLAVAVALLATALLAQAGLLGGVAVALAWLATLVLLNPDPLPPVLGAAIAAALLGVAQLVRPRLSERQWWSRWDAPLALMAVPIAGSAALTSIGTVDEPITSALVGSLALAAAVQLRRIPWAAGVLSVVGVLLVLSGADAGGPWWFAGALVLLAAGLTGAAARTDGPAELALQLSGAVTAVLAWSAIVRAADWSLVTAADVSAVGAGVVTLGLAVGAWSRRVGRWWAVVWGGTAAAVVAAMATGCWAQVGDLEPTGPLVVGLALITGAFLVSARPLDVPWLRVLGSLGIVATLLTALHVLTTTPTQQVLTLVTVSAACGIATLLTTADTRRTTIEVGVLTATAAIGIALQPDYAPNLLIAALAVSSLQAASVGSALRNLTIQALSPVLACAAWLVFAAESLNGDNAQWWADVSAVGAGVVTLGLAVGAWSRRVGRWWAVVWGGTAAAVVAAMATGCWAQVGDLEPTGPLVVGLALITGAFLVSARPLDVPWLRVLGSLGIVATLLTALHVLTTTPTQQVLTLVTVSAACGIATLLTTADTRRTTIEVGVLTATAAIGIALQPDYAPNLLIAALAVSSLQAASVGSALRNLTIQALSPVLACAAWLVFAAESLNGDNAQWWADVSAVGAGVVTLGLAVGAWSRRVGRWWAVVWGGTAAAVVAAMATGCWAQVGDLEPTGPLVVGLALITGAFLVSARPLDVPWLRVLGSLGIVATLLTALHVLTTTPTQQVLTLVTVSAACGIATLLTTADTRRTTIEVGVLTATAAIGIALQPDYAPNLLIAALAVSSLQAASVGSALRNLTIQALSPVLACAAWLVFAAESLNGRVQWWTAPVGLALLVVVGLWRRDRIRQGESPSSPEIVAVELVGVGLLVGASLVLMVTENLTNVLPALALGVAITGWGVITRVRRRVLAGGLVVLAAAVLVLAVPLLQNLPDWGGAGLWILIACVGITALLVASLIEQGRSATKAAIGRLSDLTKEWE